MRKKTSELYDEIRIALSFDKNADDVWVVVDELGVEHALLCNGKPVVTPTDHILKESNWDKYQPFHPLAENIRRNNSIVFTHLKEWVSLRLKSVTYLIITAIAELAKKTEIHATLSAGELKLVELFNGSTDKTIGNIAKAVKLMRNATPGGEELLALTVSRNGEIDGRKCDRIAKVCFPIMNEEAKAGGKIYELSMSVRDKAILYRTLRFIFPDIDTPEKYTFGCSGAYAPQFTVLMQLFHKLAVDLNKVTEVLGVRDSDFYTANYINLDWFESIANLRDFKDEIVPLQGNEGELPNAGSGASVTDYNRNIPIRKNTERSERARVTEEGIREEEERERTPRRERDVSIESFGVKPRYVSDEDWERKCKGMSVRAPRAPASSDRRRDRDRDERRDSRRDSSYLERRHRYDDDDDDRYNDRDRRGGRDERRDRGRDRRGSSRSNNGSLF